MAGAPTSVELHGDGNACAVAAADNQITRTMVSKVRHAQSNTLLNKLLDRFDLSKGVADLLYYRGF